MSHGGKFFWKTARLGAIRQWVLGVIFIHGVVKEGFLDKVAFVQNLEELREQMRLLGVRIFQAVGRADERRNQKEASVAEER